MKESTSQKNPHVAKTTKDVYIKSWQVSTDDLNDGSISFNQSGRYVYLDNKIIIR